MRIKTIGGIALAITLLGGMAAPAAYADELTDEAPLEVAAVVETEAPVEAVEVETPEPEPVVEVAPVEVAKPAPVVETKPAPFSAYRISARWIIPASWDYATTPYYTAAIFPQPAGESIPCNQWAQDDVYLIDSVADEALYASLDDDGVLTMGEDSAIYLTHVFTKGEACVVIPPVVTYPVVITPAVPTFTTAPTCDTDGTYVLPEGPAAQNHNPTAGLHGVELDGYHLYVRNTSGEFGAPGAYTWQAYGIGAKGNEAYPLGTSVGGKVDSNGNPKAGGMVSGTFTVAPATDDCPVVIDPPVEPPVVIDPPVTVEPPVEVPVVVEPAIVAAPVAARVSTDRLATTGSNDSPVVGLGIALAVILAGLGAVLFGRRRVTT